MDQSEKIINLISSNDFDKESEESDFTDANNLGQTSSSGYDGPNIKDHIHNINSFLNSEINLQGNGGAQQDRPPIKATMNLKIADVGNSKTDFQDDFLSKYDEFSESWREGVRQMKRF